MSRFEYVPFLFLLFIGTLCGSMIVPYMGYYIVTVLGHEPWTISLYAGMVSVLAIALNRKFAQWIDAEAVRPFPLIGLAAVGCLIGSVSQVIWPSFWTVLTVGVIGFGASTSAMSTMFSLGGTVANKSNVNRNSFTAYMRATMSAAWMIGPAMTFFVSSRLGSGAVFEMSAVLCLAWLATWWWAAPRDMVRRPTVTAGTNGAAQPRHNDALWFGIAFIFCLSVAHSLTFTALPIFYVKEVGLPAYAPGTAFTVKTLIEVFAIFSTPYLITRFGIRRSLLGAAILAVVTIQVLAAVKTYPQMLTGAAMEGLYYGLFASLGITFVQAFDEAHPARATAVYWNTLTVTGILAGPIAGLIAQIWDFRTVILVASVVALVSVPILIIGSRRELRNGALSAR